MGVPKSPGVSHPSLEKNLFNDTKTVLPKRLDRRLLQPIFIISKADPQFTRKGVAKEEHTSLTLPRARGERVQFDIRIFGMLIDTI